MPRNAAVGFVVGILAFIFSFAMIWHIWWLGIISLVATIGTLVIRSFNYDTDYYLKADEVERIETQHQQELARAGL